MSSGSAVAHRVKRRLAPAPPVLLFAQAGHVLGDMAAVALAETLFFAVPVGEARLKVGLYLALAFAPYAVLSPLATRLLGQGLRAYGAAVVVSDVGRALTCAALVTRMEGPALYPLGFVILVLSRLHTVARHSLMPRLVGEGENLLEANAAVLGFTSMVIAFRFHGNGATGLSVGLGALFLRTGLAPLAVRPVRRLFGRHLTLAALALLVVTGDRPLPRSRALGRRRPRRRCRIPRRRGPPGL